MGERTEAATPRRRSEARRRGQVPRSSDLTSTLVFLGLLFAVRNFGPASGTAIKNYMDSVLNHMAMADFSPVIVMQAARDAVLVIIKAVGPILAVGMALAVAVNIAQTNGPVFATEAMTPDFNRINPAKGLQRFFSSRAFVDLAKSIVKIGFIGSIAYSTTRDSYPKLVMTSRMDIMNALGLIGGILFDMAVRIVVGMLVLASIDYFYQRWQHEKQLKMSKEEIKQESKQAEGDPQLKARIRARQRSIAKKRMMADVPAADVIITNPTHFAVALRYDGENMGAPVVVAKGQDLIAKRIREIARENDIPIVENPPLARTLFKHADIGREIPADLYEAVAEVLAFVYQIKQRRAPGAVR